MDRHSVYLVFVFTLAAIIALTSPYTSRAKSMNMPSAAGSAFDLVNAVNALRASYGLAPYSISPILMFTAQSHAEFMAASGNVSHTGFGGSTLTDRLLAAGYPLAGDLSLGGFRAENITSGNEDRSAQSAVDGWTGDALHLDTMLSPNLSEIGAGVAIANGRVYYVIDAAQPTNGEVLPGSTSVTEGGSTIPSAEATMAVAVVSTPNPEGDVVHEVQAGQSLWQIAIAYEVKIDDIKRLNNLLDNNIYPGNRLLIKTDVAASMLPTASTTDVPAGHPTVHQTSSLTTLAPVTAIPSSISRGTSVNNVSTLGMVIGIVVLALLGGGYFAWLGSNRKEKV